MDHPHPPSVIADRNGDQAVDRVPLLAVRQLTKRFGSLVANNAIDLDVHTGEIHAVLGENGAGKSTLMKLLYGFYQPDEGKLLWQGQPATLHSPLDGRRLGIGMVFQNFTLIPALTVIENIALFLPDLGRVLQPRVIAQRIKELAARYELTVPVYARVGDLSLGEQQKVEILKILLGGARVLIFDEPTSVLAPHEAEGLFRIFDWLRADGFALLFITHKMPEVLACADRITVLRRGAVAGTLLRAEATETKMVSLMLDAVPPKTVRTATAPAVRPTQPLLELRAISTRNARNEATLQDISFTPWPDEVVIDKPGKNAFYATNLSEILQAKRIKNLIVTGVTTDVCCSATVIAANDAGYNAIILQDCVASYDPNRHAAALATIKAQGGIFGWVSDSASVLAAIEEKE